MLCPVTWTRGCRRYVELILCFVQLVRNPLREIFWNSVLNHWPSSIVSSFNSFRFIVVIQICKVRSGWRFIILTKTLSLYWVDGFNLQNVLSGVMRQIIRENSKHNYTIFQFNLTSVLKKYLVRFNPYKLKSDPQWTICHNIIEFLCYPRIIFTL